ncbi:hypothetical protein H6F90_04690 [Trichocoleus sp. FACHB-591]|uniref:hypothetical protein n=1 Tax=Trichocoleus sp. FACHB-591 TaxID=2692872 RepID=UPI001683F356|nr:hypothetical protein [Trichocoleus sp. FACHB-591]MBD2094448.1 hypothetical protein [Trichocoleus sp. FACHB-591]
MSEFWTTDSDKQQSPDLVAFPNWGKARETGGAIAVQPIEEASIVGFEAMTTADRNRYAASPCI